MDKIDCSIIVKTVCPFFYRCEGHWYLPGSSCECLNLSVKKMLHSVMTSEEYEKQKRDAISAFAKEDT